MEEIDIEEALDRLTELIDSEESEYDTNCLEKIQDEYYARVDEIDDLKQIIRKIMKEVKKKEDKQLEDYIKDLINDSDVEDIL